MTWAGRIAALVVALVPVVAGAQTLAITGHPTPATISQIADVMRASMDTRGMSGTAEAVQRCYSNDGQPTNLIMLSSCILWDAAAVMLDEQVRKAQVAQGRNDPGPASPFLAPEAYATRRTFYGRQVFGPDPKATSRYLGDAPEQVLVQMMAQPKR